MADAFAGGAVVSMAGGGVSGGRLEDLDGGEEEACGCYGEALGVVGLEV